MERSLGVEGYACPPLCPWTHLLYFSPFITSPHTHSHCSVFVINLWNKSPRFCSRQDGVSMGKKSFHRVLVKQGNRHFVRPFLLMWRFWWTCNKQKSLTCVYWEPGFCLVEIKLDYCEVMLMLYIGTHSRTRSRNLVNLKISTLSFSTCPPGTCQFTINHGCPFHPHTRHSLFFPHCISTINLKISKANHRPSHH